MKYHITLSLRFIRFRSLLYWYEFYLETNKEIILKIDALVWWYMYTVSLLDWGQTRNSVSDSLPNYAERVVEHCYSFACNKSGPKIMKCSHLPWKLRDLRQARHESWRACRKSRSFQDLVMATQHWYSVRAASVTLAQHCVSAVQMSPAKLFLFEGSKFLDTRKRVFLCCITWHWVSLWWRCWEVVETDLLYTWAHTTRNK